MKRVAFSFFTFIFLLLFALAGCSSDNAKGSDSDTGTQNGQSTSGLIRIGFSQVGSESDWRLANTKSMKEAFSEANGFDLIFKDAQQKPENQVEAVKDFIKQKVDYIVIAPIREDGWDDVLIEAKDAKIPVIIVDRMIDIADESLFTCWVGSDFRKEGDTAIAWMKEKFGEDELNIVHLQGSMGSSAQIGRSKGLDAGVEANSGWKVLVSESGDFTETQGKEVMERILKQYPDIDVLYCENDNMAFGAMQAMSAAGSKFGDKGGITIISFDATKEGLKATFAGDISYNVECNPLHGPRVSDIVKELETGKTLEKKYFVEESAFAAATITEAEIEARSY